MRQHTPGLWHLMVMSMRVVVVMVRPSPTRTNTPAVHRRLWHPHPRRRRRRLWHAHALRRQGRMHDTPRAAADEVERVPDDAEERGEVLLHGLDAPRERDDERAADRARDGARERGERCCLQRCGEHELYEPGGFALEERLDRLGSSQRIARTNGVYHERSRASI